MIRRHPAVEVKPLTFSPISRKPRNNAVTGSNVYIIVAFSGLTYCMAKLCTSIVTSEMNILTAESIMKLKDFRFWKSNPGISKKTESRRKTAVLQVCCMKV